MGIFSRNKKQIQMKNELYSRILGRDVNVGEVLSVDDLQKVQSHIEGLEHLANEEQEVVEEQVEETTATETATTQQAQTADIASIVSAAVTAAVTPIASRLETIEQTLEIKPAAGATVTTPVSAEAQDFAEKPWEDPNRSYNKLPANH
jgi:uncharacterized protein (DUF885 family)